MKNSLLELIFNLLKSNMEWLADQLALLLDKTKAKNPLVWLIVVSLGVGLVFAGNNCMFEICENEWVQFVVQLLGLAITSLAGSRTYERVSKQRKQVEA